MRFATVMMSLRLAGALTFAPEPIVMATSFSVKVWHICRRGEKHLSVYLYIRILYIIDLKPAQLKVKTFLTFKMEIQ